jgi:choline kinase
MDTPERSFIIPILADSITTMTVVVPKDFLHRVEVQALQVVDALENHPATEVDPNNKMMQAMSYIVQNALTEYLDFCEEEMLPPDVGKL